MFVVLVNALDMLGVDNKWNAILATKPDKVTHVTTPFA
jgi:hypothetical protein